MKKNKQFQPYTNYNKSTNEWTFGLRTFKGKYVCLFKQKHLANDPGGVRTYFLICLRAYQLGWW